VADCIYNPSLLPALVNTINCYTVPRHTEVMVVVELRSDEVIWDFLTLWLKSGMWKVIRLDILSHRYAVWVGRKM